eukprot:TRINITY_DN10963_c0_g1_i1.p1 TRINITY_DN10963_c0_g1~~TRINITY_DN10963_c0_g1_i1.p1  ORF type:complete len:398 (+),score=109.94 TRINITY_DN10963_c0_g1_i1:134-1327(+)
MYVAGSAGGPAVQPQQQQQVGAARPALAAGSVPAGAAAPGAVGAQAARGQSPSKRRRVVAMPGAGAPAAPVREPRAAANPSNGLLPQQQQQQQQPLRAAAPAAAPAAGAAQSAAAAAAADVPIGAAPLTLPYVPEAPPGAEPGQLPCDAAAAEKLFTAAVVHILAQPYARALAGCAAQPPRDGERALWSLLRRPPQGRYHRFVDVACAALFAAGAADPDSPGRLCAALVVRISTAPHGHWRVALLQVLCTAWVRCWHARWLPPGHAAVDTAIRQCLVNALRVSVKAPGGAAAKEGTAAKDAPREGREMVDALVVSLWRTFQLLDRSFCERIRSEIIYPQFASPPPLLHDPAACRVTGDILLTQDPRDDALAAVEEELGDALPPPAADAGGAAPRRAT